MFIKRLLIFGTLALLPAFAQDSDTSSVWREAIAHTAVPVEGCFHVSYPSIVWEQVVCKEAHPLLHSHPVLLNTAGG